MAEVTVKEVYMPPKCPDCGERPIVEHDAPPQAMPHSMIPSRVRCPGCGKRTEWRSTRFQAEIAWEEGVYDEAAGD